jgi:hypothetical protein
MINPLLAPTNSVPAVAAKQRGQVLFCLNGRKGCVGCGAGDTKILWLNCSTGIELALLESQRSRGNFVSRLFKRRKHKGTPEMELLGCM